VAGADRTFVGTPLSDLSLSGQRVCFRGVEPGSKQEGNTSFLIVPPLLRRGQNFITTQNVPPRMRRGQRRIEKNTFQNLSLVPTHPLISNYEAILLNDYKIVFSNSPRFRDRFRFYYIYRRRATIPLAISSQNLFNKTSIIINLLSRECNYFNRTQTTSNRLGQNNTILDLDPHINRLQLLSQRLSLPKQGQHGKRPLYMENIRKSNAPTEVANTTSLQNPALSVSRLSLVDNRNLSNRRQPTRRQNPVQFGQQPLYPRPSSHLNTLTESGKTASSQSTTVRTPHPTNYQLKSLRISYFQSSWRRTAMQRRMTMQ